MVFTQIDAGRVHACGLRPGGTAVCWGLNNPEGRLDVPPGARFKRITAGGSFSCGILYDESIACWGSRAPQRIDGQFAALSAGRYHLCAIDAAGRVKCWGDVPDEYHDDPPPTDESFAAIDLTIRDLACGLTKTGAVKCWGWPHRKSKPPENPSERFASLSVGDDHYCALREDGGAACAGYNTRRQSSPPPDAKFKRIAAAEGYSCGITLSGEIECWGRNRKGRSGQRLGAPTGKFIDISLDYNNYCGLRANGYAVCWSHDPPEENDENMAAAFGGRVFVAPTELFTWPGGGLAVVERSGSVSVYEAETDEPLTILDLTDSTAAKAQRGMLGAALDPDFVEFPFLYLYYNRGSGGENATARLSRFPVSDGYADPDEELVLLEMPHADTIHQGGGLRFGPDGMLYLSLGDNRTRSNGQDLGSLWGSVIRIDVRGASAERPYRIPEDNPFIDTPGARAEIWARGLRSPYRMAFGGGGLFVSDVGGGWEEEVSIAAAGANLGWAVFEGESCFGGEDACAALQDAAPPIHSYTRHDYGCAIIGGPAISEPYEAYIFGDFCAWDVWALRRGGQGNYEPTRIAYSAHPIISFGTDADGAVYVLTINGPIKRLDLEPDE